MQNKLTRKQMYLAGYTVNYWEGGVLSNTDPILFLHGWGLSVEAYLENLNLLCKRYRVIAPDLLGFGKSSDPKSIWNIKDYAQFTIAFAQRLNLRNVHLMGHSFGGGISIEVASLSPETIRSIILLNSIGIPTKSISHLILKQAIEFIAQTWETNFQIQNWYVLQTFLENSLFHFHYMIQMMPILKEDLRESCSRMEVPCLIVWGSNDRVTPLNAGQQMLQLIEGAQWFVVEEGYHLWSIVLPEKLEEIAFDFLDKFNLKSEQLSTGSLL